MAYSTPADVRRAASPAAAADPANPPDDTTGTAADLSDPELTDAIAEADSTIDSYLGGRYATPIDVNGAAPHPLDWWSRNIALYNATLTQRGQLDFTDNDPIARRYNATMAALTAIRDGKAILPNVPELAAGGTDGSGETEGAGQAIQQYDGQLFSTGDFSLVPSSPFHDPWWGRGYLGNF